MKTPMEKSKKIQCTYSYAILTALPFFLAALTALLFISFFIPVILLLLPVLLIYSTYKVFLQRSNIYIISPTVIMHEYGIFSVTTGFLEVFRIRDFKLDEPFLLRLINSMTITIVNTDMENSNLILTGIPKSNIILELRELVELMRKEKNVYVVE